MKKILITEMIPEEAFSLLKGKAQVVIAKDRGEEAILDEVGDVYGIVLKSASKITRSIIQKALSLKVISRTGAGYDNVDVEAATEHGVMVCNLPGINSVSVAEHTIAMILALAKQLITMDAYVRNNGWDKRSGYTAMDVAGKKLGIVGLGKIGQEVMKKCKYGLGMKILVYDPYVQDLYKEDIEFCDSLEDLFTESDIITLHVPNIPETQGMISRELISQMKPSAFLINTSRGEVVDEEALVEALREGRIRGAGLDVFSKEPIPSNHPFIQLPNVILTPHTAALTRECAVKMAVEAVRQVIDCLEGRIPPHVVNRKELGIEELNMERKNADA